MLKKLFTSKVRIKLLTLFLSHPDEEFFIRELTRKLDEQINSVRRELDNLKKIGLLTSKMRNRKKYYTVDKNFILFNELRGIFLKAQNANEDLVESITKLGRIDLLVISGMFLNKEAESDILLVGEIDKNRLADLLEDEVDQPVRFTVMHKEDFLYRLKCNDRFITKIINDRENIFAVNKLDKHI